MNHLVIAPVLLPLLAGILLLLLRRPGMAQCRGRVAGGRVPGAPARDIGAPCPAQDAGGDCQRHLLLQRVLSVAAVAAQIGLAVGLMVAVSDGDILTYTLGNWPAPFGIVLVADRLAAWMLLITALLSLFALLSAIRGTDHAGRHFHVLFQLLLFGLNGAFLTGDLFNLFVFFEILLLASYGLLLHGGGRLRTRAGLHFVVINLAGSTLFLFAVGTLYGVLGTLNMADLAVKVAATPPENVPLVRAAGLLLFGVFALKAALLPLYLWLPAAYAHTSAPVAALFAIMTKVGAYSILRVYTLIFGDQAGPIANLIEDWLLPLALATLAVGMLGAVGSTHLRQQVAYLVVASIGSLLTAFGLNTVSGIAAGLYYLPHATFAAAAFFLLTDAIALRRSEMGDRLDPGPVIVGQRLLGALFFVTAMLVAGLPPLSGFLSKFLMLRAALAHPALPWVMGVVLVTALLGLIALARSGSLLFYRAVAPGILPPATLSHPSLAQPAETAIARMQEVGQREEQLPWTTTRELAPIIGLLALCLALTIWAGPATDFAHATAEQLLQPSAYIHAVLGEGVNR